MKNIHGIDFCDRCGTRYDPTFTRNDTHYGTNICNTCEDDVHSTLRKAKKGFPTLSKKRNSFYVVLHDNSGLNNSVGVLFPSERIARNFIARYQHFGECRQFEADVYGTLPKNKTKHALPGKNDRKTFNGIMAILVPDTSGKYAKRAKRAKRKQTAFDRAAEFPVEDFDL